MPRNFCVLILLVLLGVACGDSTDYSERGSGHSIVIPNKPHRIAIERVLVGPGLSNGELWDTLGLVDPSVWRTVNRYIVDDVLSEDAVNVILSSYDGLTQAPDIELDIEVRTSIIRDTPFMTLNPDDFAPWLDYPLGIGTTTHGAPVNAFGSVTLQFTDLDFAAHDHMGTVRLTQRDVEHAIVHQSAWVNVSGQTEKQILAILLSSSPEP